jgi:segregation and condensation protein A
MHSIHERVSAEDRIELHELFEPGLHKSALVGLFLATLEMIRYHGLVAHQEASEGALWLCKGVAFPKSLEIRLDGDDMPV